PVERPPELDRGEPGLPRGRGPFQQRQLGEQDGQVHVVAHISLLPLFPGIPARERDRVARARLLDECSNFPRGRPAAAIATFGARSVVTSCAATCLPYRGIFLP